MITNKTGIRIDILICAAILGLSSASTSCSSNESKAKEVIMAYMKNQGVTDLTIDSFITSSSVPGKAYTSATATYNFASGSGNPQKEYLGFILVQEGRVWRIERNTGYTKDRQQAEKFLAGGK